MVGVDERAPVTVWPRPAARRLVTLLLLSPEHLLARDALGDRLFPHLPPDKRARALSKALSLARSVLDQDDRTTNAASGTTTSVLAADAVNVRFADGLRVEVDLFAHEAALHAALATSAPDEREGRLRAALEERRAALVDDRYEPWAIEVADALDRLRCEALTALARTSGRVADWQAAADAAPVDPTACEGLVGALVRADRRADALHALEVHRAALADLGLEPVPRLLALARTVTGTASTPPRRDAPGAFATIWPLYGRDAELSALLDVLAAARDGHGTTALVAAPAGMGKTHLLRHTVSRSTAAGWTVAAATSVRGDRRAPFAALRTALGALPLPAPPPALARVLRPDAWQSPEVPAAAAELAALADAVSAELDGLAATDPVLLCLDDLHWADHGLQDVISRLAAGIRPRRWALLLAARTDEPDAPVPDLPTEVARLSLQPLDAEASLQLAEHAAATAGAPDDARARRAAERGAGHPLYTVELARAHDLHVSETAAGAWHAVPERIVALLHQRVSRCSPAARRVLAIVAIAGEDASLGVLERATADLLGPQSDLAALLTELADASLLVAGRTPRLIHPLQRDAAEHTLDPLRRAALHLRVAQALASEPAAGSTAVSTLSIARHQLAAFEATGLERHAALAAPTALEAGAIAQGAGAAAAATELFEGGLRAHDALGGPERSRLRRPAFEGWLGLGQVRLDQGAYHAASLAFAAASDLAERADERALACRWAAQVPYRQGDLMAAIALLDGGLDSLVAPGRTGGPDEDLALPQARLLIDLGWARFRRGETEPASDLLVRAVDLAEDAGDWLVLAQALDRVAFVRAHLGDHAAALPLYDRALQAAAASGDPHELAVTHIHHVAALFQAGRFDAAAAELEAARALCDHHGFRYSGSLVHWAAADLAEARGDPERALAERDTERDLLAGLHNDRNLAGCHAHRALLLGRLGRHDDAEVAAAAARDAAARLGDPTLRDQVERTLATGVRTSR
jgi:DNA-binding SARP family transcriptional activator/tetratricopeptide (TPR) repeat protein